VAVIADLLPESAAAADLRQRIEEWREITGEIVAGRPAQ